MKKKHYLVTIIILITSKFSHSQEFTLYGKIEDQIGPIENANIWNKESNKGSFSDENGMFSIKVSLDQKIEISSIQHHTKIVRITQDILISQTVTVQLRMKDNLLEEVNISNKKLFETYKRKNKQTIRDIAVVKSKDVFDFSEIKIEANKNYKKATNMARDMGNITDPTQRFEGANIGGGVFLPFKSLFKKRKEKKKFEFKANFPELLLKEFGASYFFTDLKIPKENYYHFLDFCNPLGIEKLYQENKKLELLEVLNIQAKEYLINNNHK
ncbi:hypothetical protein BTO06_08460 [Tenacibaculum sp. SZ-18]|uniref:carboxypeptidase-like regulatory domain-containing protein n=1 Tax=Tenacibaculum sp. SZ-18 TaxID=754423 RepID=UPI000C2D4B83|nr:carboxypeptidase-like regulatory domain-containing protein [Tenacibaculum sp. SZ-18]AUC15168.1 hypothetical protein BTO06_08460 [Tenacibaculum sp. SZ-18]